MQFVIKKNELLTGLQQIVRVIPSRTTKPILYGVKIDAEFNRIRMTAYDLEIGLEILIENKDQEQVEVLQVEEPGSIVINAKFLLEIIRKLPQQLVRFNLKNHIATIQSGAAIYTLNGLDSREFPLLPQVDDDEKLTMASTLLLQSIQKTVYAVATIESRPTLTGVHFKLKNDILTLTGTDSHRLSNLKISVDTLKEYSFEEAIMPGKTLQELLRILPASEEMVEITLADHQMLIRYDNIHFYSRLIEGTYPDISRIIPETFRTSIKIGTKNLIESIERAALLARENDNHVIRLHLRPNQTEITSTSQELGKISEVIEPQTFQGEELMLACNARFMLESLKTIDTEDVSIQFTGPGSAFIITPVESDTNHLQLILPVRLNHA
ncbi:DNA polymerase III subunit beta [Ferroacidibacillus organovorans]|uniref:Beta sliding clamp n=1 Tax=Ferroacidibacillus organovorans TaxID=1765683 RepID=A0A162TGQ4_9BACL|nr:DNA polymerase III subunit beta [Ferroacidibacillus organovorans]KYP80787.1 hypothetical protein AYJ22_09925 [Ferroacidibacillus organovorans]OAG93569.1 hypothetical protein AYW79_10080 [Ferroacidibacillus organovorans]OPG16822.1 DNA polymerase III subunit beta [Ferroacidibacillus organovorans]